jgi:hypothetical protein
MVYHMDTFFVHLEAHSTRDTDAVHVKRIRPQSKIRFQKVVQVTLDIFGNFVPWAPQFMSFLTKFLDNVILHQWEVWNWHLKNINVLHVWYLRLPFVTEQLQNFSWWQ